MRTGAAPAVRAAEQFSWYVLAGACASGARTTADPDEAEPELLIVPVDELPARPDPLVLGRLADVHEAVTEGVDVAHLAMALCRPGHPTTTVADEEWAEGLGDVLGTRLDGTWSLHLAAAGRVVPVAGTPGWRLPAR